MENNRRFLTVEKSVALMAIFLPALYLIGYFYESGYLSVYSVSADFFPRSVADYLTLSFSVISRSLVDLWLWVTRYWCYIFILLPCLFGYFLISVFGAYLSRNSTFINRHVAGYFNRIKTTRGFWFVFVPLGVSVFTICFFLFLLLLLVGVILGVFSFHQYGVNTAKDEIKGFHVCYFKDEKNSRSDVKAGSNMQKCIYIYRDDTPVMSGILITADATHAAIWDGEKSVIVELSGKRLDIVRRAFSAHSQISETTER